MNVPCFGTKEASLAEVQTPFPAFCRSEASLPFVVCHYSRIISWCIKNIIFSWSHIASAVVVNRSLIIIQEPHQCGVLQNMGSTLRHIYDAGALPDQFTAMAFAIVIFLLFATQRSSLAMLCCCPAVHSASRPC